MKSFWRDPTQFVQFREYSEGFLHIPSWLLQTPEIIQKHDNILELSQILLCKVSAIFTNNFN
jgi:hypothetical protein